MFPSPEPHQALKAFRIERRLGAGGAGEVFLAHSKGGKQVAIKVLSDARVRDAAFAQELAREASLCVRLSHPAIVQVRALIEEEGFAAIVFDYVEGIALARLLKLCSSRGVRLPDNVAWHIVERVASALAYAHMQTDEARAPAPIVHRDVSPSNVLIGWTGDVKLTDFGIAKMLGVSPATQYGLVKGTLGCMAPEQARGERVDERADVYAVGLLAWRLSTGRNPYATYEKDEMELLRAMRNPRIKPLSALRPDLPEALSEAVERALAPQADARTVTAEELASVARANVEIDRGQSELRELLERFRMSLEKKRARVGGAAGPASAGPEGTSSTYDSSSSSSGSHKFATARYDDIPQDEEDEADVERPTLQVQALPGDAQAWERRSTPEPFVLPRAVPSEQWLAAAPSKAPSPAPSLAPSAPPVARALAPATPTTTMPLPHRQDAPPPVDGAPAVDRPASLDLRASYPAGFDVRASYPASYEANAGAGEDDDEDPTDLTELPTSLRIPPPPRSAAAVASPHTAALPKPSTPTAFAPIAARPTPFAPLVATSRAAAMERAHDGKEAKEGRDAKDAKEAIERGAPILRPRTPLVGRGAAGVADGGDLPGTLAAARPSRPSFVPVPPMTAEPAPSRDSVPDSILNFRREVVAVARRRMWAVVAAVAVVLLVFGVWCGASR